MIALAELNALPRDAFTGALAGIFEHSPWVPAGAAATRPYPSREALHAAMCQVVREAGVEAQLGLIRAHPELAGKAAIAGELTAHSASEQRGAGLDQCTPAEYAELVELNRRYRERHGFPFILAVRGHTRASIIAALRERVEQPTEAEIATCLEQIEKIARLRLDDLVAD
ncbi:2-oxo-4-hydroxy-4-carboxy-5-ureidoimidazoline decarboxylase [Pseudoxanthomonas winnipegensis]|uniref:2-oxo-4-hydroxy-4-carboxy-5-ureidoimidazoline decarboxylase n=1 Tax=Pseudoxanthomonas winnipegensis TaxID=2480810 RepID=A0A4Q8LXV0_9GAMM|nr:2-oxo-4-hydroxy-4-carboxy-5-ureidoimidazoline decarboxylase [Pseudoxanthomonas winnipegensis]TAA37403.1 2-oxo-4-hydroxy-4-carboxy-5-ureidoimidazoline decarboxylase [Pseudoxanthomonas winnipegensis]